MKPKQKVVLYLSLFFIASICLLAYSFYGESTKEADFGEFSIQVPPDSEFENITKEYSGEHNFTKSYRCKNIDLTVTSFDKDYLENTYEYNTGNKIDFGKEVLKRLSGFENPKVNKSSENITFFITNTHVDGYISCDVAGVYNDNDHIIIVEGGDIELIEKVTNSIKINDNYNN